MNDLVIYLLKVSAGITLFHLCHFLLFRNDTFYLRNRVFLILALLLPAILPALKIPGFSNHVPEGSSDAITVIFPYAGNGMAFSGTINSFDYNNLLLRVYFSVTGLLLLRLIYSLIITFRIIKKGSVIRNQFPKIVVSSDHYPPFSFYPFAVIRSDDYENGKYNDILDHEIAHIRQGHTFDLLFAELYIAFQWFNPFVWLIKRAIILNHEYLADHASLSKSKDIKEYQYRLINFQPELKSVSFAHNFNNLIKNRIVMINKKSSSRLAGLKNLLVLPVLSFVLFSFTKPEDPNAYFSGNSLIYETQDKISKEVEGFILQQDGKPLQGAAIVVKDARVGTISDLEGRFKLINIAEDAMLVVSYVGFKTQVVKPDFGSEMTVKMVRNTLSTDKVNVTPSEKSKPSEKNMVIVEELPVFPGGQAAMMRWIADNITYPAEAVKGGIQGLVNVNFVVSSSGKIKNVRINKSVHPLLDAEAVKVIGKMPDWKPGSQNGKTVDVDLMVPVEFKLE